MEFADSEENILKKEIFTETTKAVIYCRISTLGQKEGISLEVQENVCTRFCNERGWEISLVIKEISSAAKAQKQKLLMSVPSAFSNTKLVVYNISRFSRNVAFGLQIKEQLMESKIDLISSMEQVDDTPSGEYNFINLLNAAEFESKMIGKRISDALTEKKVLGYRFGMVPFGMKVERDKDKKRTFVKHDEESRIVDFILACRTMGKSLDDLNSLMKSISGQHPHVDIEFDRDSQCIEDKLSFSNICNLLNDYGVLKRGKQWTTKSVYRVVRMRLDRSENKSLNT